MFKALAALDQPEEVARVDDRVVPGPVDVPVRVYTPEEAIGGDAPLLVWLHGGGWVIGDLDTADATARALANRSGAVVVSVDYRLAPEHAAPAALDDALGGPHLGRRELGAARRRRQPGRRGRRLGRREPRGRALPPRPRRVRPGHRLPAARLPGDRLHAEPPVDGGERRGLLPHEGHDGLVRGSLPRGRRPEGSVGVAAARRVARRPPSCPGDHGGVRPAPRRRRGLRRRAARGRHGGRSRCGTTARSTASSRWPRCSTTPRSRSTRREPRCEPPSASSSRRRCAVDRRRARRSTGGRCGSGPACGSRPGRGPATLVTRTPWWRAPPA